MSIYFYTFLLLITLTHLYLMYHKEFFKCLVIEFSKYSGSHYIKILYNKQNITPHCPLEGFFTWLFLCLSVDRILLEIILNDLRHADRKSLCLHFPMKITVSCVLFVIFFPWGPPKSEQCDGSL